MIKKSLLILFLGVSFAAESKSSWLKNKDELLKVVSDLVDQGICFKVVKGSDGNTEIWCFEKRSEQEGQCLSMTEGPSGNISFRRCARALDTMFSYPNFILAK